LPDRGDGRPVEQLHRFEDLDIGFRPAASIEDDFQHHLALDLEITRARRVLGDHAFDELRRDRDGADRDRRIAESARGPSRRSPHDAGGNARGRRRGHRLG
jgi:hypothetical protein